MITSNPFFVFGSTLAAAAVLSIPASSQAGLIFTYENAGVQSTSVPGVTTEDFEGGGPYNTLGTFTNLLVSPADVFGGAGGAGNFLDVAPNTTTTLDLTSAQNYVGLWWSAGDPNNTLSFYDNGSLVETYQVGDILSGLPPAYFGNPNPGFPFVDEPYAYLNFTTTGTTEITSIEFTQGSSGRFEADNISVLDQVIDPPGNPTNVPDSGNLLVIFLGTVGLLVGFHRKQAGRK